MDWEQATPGDPSNWLKVLDRHKVDQCFLMGHAALRRIDWAAQDNTTVTRVAALHPSRLLPVATAWPQGGKEMVAEVKRAIGDLKVRGLKFHPWLQGFSVVDQSFNEMVGMAGEASIPVFFHDGTPCYSLSEQIGGVARRFPKTTIVLAHSGLLWNWRSALEASRLDNVWLCLCGPHVRTIEILAERAPSERLVWGSDFGAGQADQIEYRLNLIRRAKMRAGLLDRILGPNAVRLSKLGA
jgi:predicted TIM-barrel fold metal-dependent hydrolase